MSALLPPAVHAVTYVPRPAPVPDTRRDLAAAIAVRLETAPRVRLTGERAEASTVRPGAAS